MHHEIIVSFLEGDGVAAPIAIAASCGGALSGEVKRRRIRGQINGGIELGGGLSGTVKRLRVNGVIGVSLKTDGKISGGRQRQTSINLRLKATGALSGSVRLALVQPAPVLNEIAPDAFAKQFYTARLLGDNVEIQITSATVEKPKGALGARVSCRIAKKDLSLITPSKLYKFQIGTRATWNGAVSWETILENAELDSRSYSHAWGSNQPADDLSFSTIAPLMDKLNRFPLNTIVFFDPRKTDFTVDDSEKIRISGGGVISINGISENGLNLYSLLDHVRKRTGFASIQTNIPNFEIRRADFPFSQSWNDSLRGILGVFEVLPRMKPGNILEFLDKTQPVPEDFAPEILYVRNYRDLNLNMPSGGAIDGFILSYVVSDTNANFYEDRTVETSEEAGTFGAANFTRTTIVRTFRDWKHTDDPEEILRTELIREVHSTYNNSLELIGRETTEHSFDAQGKKTGSSRTVESMVPDLENNGAAALLETRIESQTISYKTDPRNPRRQIQDKIITQTRGLIAVDSENQYFDEDFRQDLTEAHKAGNLSVSMTSEFGAIKTVTETLTPLGNNQYEVRVSTVDHLRGTTTNGTSEPRTGDASLNSIGGKTKQLVILREGLTNASRTGRPLVPFALGEVPLQLGKPLAQRRLKRIIERKQEGSVNVIGWHSSVERGVYFRIHDRSNNNFGTFLAEGLRAQFDNLGSPNQTVITQIDISEV